MRLNKYLNEEYEVKHISRKSILKTDIPPSERSLDNLPRDSKKNAKCRFNDWLEIPRNCGKGSDGKYYGWTHRAIYGFGKGDTVEGDSMAHKDYKWDDYDTDTKHKSYTIKSDKDAQEHAKRFMRAVS